MQKPKGSHLESIYSQGISGWICPYLFHFFSLLFYVYYYWVKIYWKKQHRPHSPAAEQLLWKQTSWSPVRRQTKTTILWLLGSFVWPILEHLPFFHGLHQLPNLLADWMEAFQYQLDLHLTRGKLPFFWQNLSLPTALGLTRWKVANGGRAVSTTGFPSRAWLDSSFWQAMRELNGRWNVPLFQIAISYQGWSKLIFYPLQDLSVWFYIDVLIQLQCIHLQCNLLAEWWGLFLASSQLSYR